MRFLSVADRKEAALVCHLWYDASLDPILLKDTIVMFHIPTTSSNRIPTLGQRKMPNLVLDSIDGSHHSKSVIMESCQHMYRNLQSLSLKGSDITENNLLAILAQCHNLESLDLSCCNSLFMSGQLLSKEEDVKRLKPVLKNVHELNLASIRYLSDAAFNRLTSVCPNITKLSLAGCQITFHSDAYYKGYSKNANSAILTQTNIMAFVSSCAETMKSVNFSRTSIPNEALAELVSKISYHFHPGLAENSAPMGAQEVT